MPVWSADGRELFFHSNSNTLNGALMAIPVDESEATLRPGVAEVVLEPGTWLRGGRPPVNYTYDSMTERFLVIKDGTMPNQGSVAPQIITVLNRFEELKERVPVPQRRLVEPSHNRQEHPERRF